MSFSVFVFMRAKWSGPNWLKELTETASSSSWVEAMEIIKSLCIERKEECLASSDFLAMQARVCIELRLWDIARFASNWALSIDNFGNQWLSSWAEEINTYTRVYDLVVRRKTNSPFPEFIKELKNILESSSSPKRSAEVGLERRLLEEMTSLNLYEDEVHNVLLEHHRRLPKVQVPDDTQQHENAIKMFRDKAEWTSQVDASEIGNESRYANHADNPNGILVNRGEDGSTSRLYPHLVALRNILPGDEITINYGSRYWEQADAGTDPLWLGMSPKAPFMDCIYYNGVLPDHGCCKTPGGFMIPAHDERRRTERNPALDVKQVPESHPAFPGFGLYSKVSFSKGDLICIYGGILDASPRKMRHFSKYAVMVDVKHAIGPFGFFVDSTTLTPLESQEYMPFLTPFPDISIPPRQGEDRLEDQVQNVRLLDVKTTKTICKAVMIEKLRPTVLFKLGQIKKPYDNGSRKDEDEWCRVVKKTFGEILTKPLPSVPRVRPPSDKEPTSASKKPKATDTSQKTPEKPKVSLFWPKNTSPRPQEAINAWKPDVIELD
jgi:hypothetical protein